MSVKRWFVFARVCSLSILAVSFAILAAALGHVWLDWPNAVVVAVAALYAVTVPFAVAGHVYSMRRVGKGGDMN